MDFYLGIALGLCALLLLLLGGCAVAELFDNHDNLG